MEPNPNLTKQNRNKNAAITISLFVTSQQCVNPSWTTSDIFPDTNSNRKPSVTGRGKVHCRRLVKNP